MNHPLTNSFTHLPKFLAISSINYGYVPSTLEYPKTLYVTLERPPPSDFRVGSTVRIQLRPGIGINTNNPGLNSVFIADDIVGKNVILLPLSDNWKADLGNPYQTWGYDMRRTNVRPPQHSSEYGFGAHQSFLEYYPREF
jgi:hypothetical protein